MTSFIDQNEKLYRYALEEGDNVIYQMLNAFHHHPENWGSWEDFLIDTIFALSAVNKASQAHLVEVLSKQSPPSIVVPITNFVPDGAWLTDYK